MWQPQRSPKNPSVQRKIVGTTKSKQNDTLVFVGLMQHVLSFTYKFNTIVIFIVVYILYIWFWWIILYNGGNFIAHMIWFSRLTHDRTFYVALIAVLMKWFLPLDLHQQKPHGSRSEFPTTRWPSSCWLFAATAAVSWFCSHLLNNLSASLKNISWLKI